MGTMPLGLAPTELVQRALQGYPNMYFGSRGMGVFAYHYFVATGRVTASAARRIFLRPCTAGTHVGSLASYLDRVASAPPDGLLTMSHFVPFSCRQDASGTPVLILGADDDVIYPPSVMRPYFETRFPNATHLVAQEQAHCFADQGWQQSMAEPLVDWLEAVEPRVFSTGF